MTSSLLLDITFLSVHERPVGTQRSFFNFCRRHLTAHVSSAPASLKSALFAGFFALREPSEAVCSAGRLHIHPRAADLLVFQGNWEAEKGLGLGWEWEVGISSERDS